MSTTDPVTLATLHGGAAGELFQRELARALDNIADPNTPAKAKRTITLQVAIVPDEDRAVGDVVLTVVSKLPGPKAAATRLFFGRRGGKVVAIEADPKQPGLFDEKAPNGGGKITPLHEAK